MKITQLLSNEGKEILMDIKQEDGSFKLPIIDKIAMGKRIQEIRKIEVRHWKNLVRTLLDQRVRML